MRGSLNISLNQDTPKDDKQRPCQVYKLSSINFDEEEEKMPSNIRQDTERGQYFEINQFCRKYTEME